MRNYGLIRLGILPKVVLERVSSIRRYHNGVRAVKPRIMSPQTRPKLRRTNGTIYRLPLGLDSPINRTKQTRMERIIRGEFLAMDHLQSVPSTLVSHATKRIQLPLSRDLLDAAGEDPVFYRPMRDLVVPSQESSKTLALLLNH